MTAKRTTFGKKGQVLHSQAREIVANVIQFMKDEAEVYQQTRDSVIPLTNYKQRVIAATGISERMYRTIVKEAASVSSGIYPTFSSPRHRKKEDECCLEEEIDFTNMSNNSEYENTVVDDESVLFLSDAEIPNDFPITSQEIKLDPLNFELRSNKEMKYSDHSHFIKQKLEVKEEPFVNEPEIRNEPFRAVYIKQEESSIFNK